MSEKQIIGKEEWCSLPELGLPAVKARVDSGAKTSALHAFNIRVAERDGKRFARFEVQPLQERGAPAVRCEAELVDRRPVKNSGGDEEMRCVIRTALKLGSRTRCIEITLANRDPMGYRMLLGREALAGDTLIDPEASFVLGDRAEHEAAACYSVPPLQKPLRIVVLASDPLLYSNKRLMEAGERRGHHMRFLNVRQCFIRVGGDGAGVYARDGTPVEADAVIPRLRPAVTFYGCAVLRQFRSAGVFCLNDDLSVSRSRDKLRSLQVLSEQGVDIPVTGFADSPQDTGALLKSVGGAPVVIKLLEGTQGRGVALAETDMAAGSVINAFKSLQANILVQEFLREAKGEDIRCFVVDGKIAGSMRRTAADGDFRSNLHLGGTARPASISPEEKKAAVKAAKATGLKAAGVDIIRSQRGPLVIEINSSPGLEGIEAATGRDIASMMIACVEKYAPPRET